MSVKKILLVWPNSEMGLFNFMPLGLGYLAANLPDDYEVEIWDGVLTGTPNEAVVDFVGEYQADVVGLSLWSVNYEQGKAITHQIKQKYPNCWVVFGGPEPSGRKQQILEDSEADFAITGDGEVPFNALLECLASGQTSAEALGAIPGLAFRDSDGQIRIVPPDFGDISDIQFCDYEKIHLREYLDKGYSLGLHPAGTRVASIQTTRGCPYPCKFCSVPLVNGRKVRERSVESVLEEIRYLHTEYGVTGISVIDDIFNFNKKYTRAVCRAIIESDLPPLSFDSPNGLRADLLVEDVVVLMKQAGWNWVIVAPESGSPETLKRMDNDQSP